MWLTVSSLSPYNLQWLFCVLSVFALVLVVLFSATIKRDSVHLLRFSFLCHLMCNLSSLSLEVSIQLFFFQFLFSKFCCFTLHPYVDITITGISLSLFFFLYSLCPQIVAFLQPSILLTPRLPSFLAIMSSLRCIIIILIIIIIIKK